MTPRSVLGIDAGLASFGCAHVEMRTPTGGPPVYKLVRGRIYVPPIFGTGGERVTVAEENAWRAAHLLRWLQPVLGQAVADGAEAFHAERYEQLRQASAAAKYAAGHAVLVAASALCEPRPKLQRAGYGGPAFVSGREAKRAATGCDVATKAVVQAAARRLIGGMGEALRGMLAEYRPHLADAGIVALRELGHRERPILIGEAPSRTSAEPFEGPCGDRLWDLIGETLPRGAGLGSAFELRNVLGAWPGEDPGGKGALFPLAQARAEAFSQEPNFDGRAVIFAGERVARAFELQILGGDDAMTWHEVRSGGAAYMAAMLPHPGVNHWWRIPKNVARARAFLRSCARLS